MRDAWPTWKAAILVFVGAFVVYALVYRAQFPGGDLDDILARSAGAAVACGLIAAVIAAISNRSRAHRR
jgi:hypothetical protein